MNSIFNALTFQWDGKNGADVPSKPMIAVTWASASFLLTMLLAK